MKHTTSQASTTSGNMCLLQQFRAQLVIIIYIAKLLPGAIVAQRQEVGTSLYIDVEGVSKQVIAISALVLPLCAAQTLLTFCLIPALMWTNKHCTRWQQRKVFISAQPKQNRTHVAIVNNLNMLYLEP